MKSKFNKKQIFAVLAVVYIVLSAFLSRGAPFYVESDEPLEDIVSICHWSSSAFPGLHGGTHHVTRKKGMVVKSGEIASCGMNWFAGLTLSFKTYDTLKHPTHEFFYDKERDDGVSVVRAKSKLELLNEKKAKFEEGFWDKYRNPKTEYARSFGGCGFGYQYLDYYSEVKQVDKNYFYKKYNGVLLECNQKIYDEVLKYDSVIAERSFNVDKTIKLIWKPEKWRKYEN